MLSRPKGNRHFSGIDPIDGLARLCQETLRHDPFVGAVFVFRNRKATALKVLMYDGQGF
nr:IS66 family insertion sequence element accessory protein TnpB [Gemmatimonadales bacterium]